MNKKILWMTFFAFLALILNVPSALAHESITVGDYEIVVGWATEPPYVGQMNAIEIHAVNTSTEQPVDDVSSLTLTISYGGQEKQLKLEKVGEDSPGRFMALILPTVPGEYSVIFGGELGDTAVDAETHVHEVQPADALAFPLVDSTQPEINSFGTIEWLAVAGFVSGLAGLMLSLLTMRNRR